MKALLSTHLKLFKEFQFSVRVPQSELTFFTFWYPLVGLTESDLKSAIKISGTIRGLLSFLNLSRPAPSSSQTSLAPHSQFTLVSGTLNSLWNLELLVL